MSKEWYYLTANGIKAGPITEDEATQLLSAGTLTHDTKVWESSFPEWVALKSTPLISLSQLPLQPPPAPAALVPKLWVCAGSADAFTGTWHYKTANGSHDSTLTISPDGKASATFSSFGTTIKTSGTWKVLRTGRMQGCAELALKATDWVSNGQSVTPGAEAFYVLINPPEKGKIMLVKMGGVHAADGRNYFFPGQELQSIDIIWAREGQSGKSNYTIEPEERGTFGKVGYRQGFNVVHDGQSVLSCFNANFLEKVVAFPAFTTEEKGGAWIGYYTKADGLGDGVYTLVFLKDGASFPNTVHVSYETGDPFLKDYRFSPELNKDAVKQKFQHLIDIAHAAMPAPTPYQVRSR